MKAVVADPTGGPENLQYVAAPDPVPAENEVVVKVEAAGVNFIDVYFRKGIYKAPESPVKLGNEAAGVVSAAGQNTRFRVGQRVAYAMSRGAYAEYASVPQNLLVELPDSVSFDQGASVMLQGMTAHYLTRSTFPLGKGQTCLIHAAAGGAGLLLVQMAKIAGATVVATCSTEEKANLVKSFGADHVMHYEDEKLVEQCKQLTGGKGVDVVYDSVGKSTFEKSLDCLKPRGMMVTFGQSSGPVGPVDPLTLMQKGSLFLTRPNLATYVADPEELRWRSSDIFGWMSEGRLKVHVHRTYALSDAASAHRDLESRQTVGKLLLKP